MLRPKTLLLDTNVWLAYLLAQGPHAEDSRKLIEYAGLHNIALLYAPSTLKDVFRLVPRILRRDALAAGEYEEGMSFDFAAWACVRTMTEVAAAAPLSIAECDMAWMLRNMHGDFEDNLVIAAAETCNADYVVTNDVELSKHFAPVCITPEQALRLCELQ